jgi:hypothetical protein
VIATLLEISADLAGAAIKEDFGVILTLYPAPSKEL